MEVLRFVWEHSAPTLTLRKTTAHNDHLATSEEKNITRMLLGLQWKDISFWLYEYDIGIS
jgi:hypothetical protein